MRLLVMILPLLIGAGPLGEGDDPSASRELQRAQAVFQGDWTFTSINDNGEKFGPELIHRAFAQNGQVTVKGRSLEVVNPETGHRRTATFRLDPSKSPRQIDLINRNDRIYRGIYKLDDDDLVICLDRSEDGPRPVDFKAPEGSERVLFRLTPSTSKASVKPASLIDVNADDAPEPAAKPPENGDRRATSTEIRRAHQLLAGEWNILSIVDDGSDVGPKLIRTKFAEDGRLRIGNRVASFVTPGTEEKHVSAIRIDPAKSPSWIDVTTQLDSVLKGIYKFDGDELILCLAKHEDNLRPTEFEAPSGSDRTLFRLAIAKPKPAAKVAAETSSVREPKAKPEPNRDQTIRDLLSGSWSYTDRRGTVTLVLRPDGTFISTRTWSKAMRRLFEGKTSTSNGTWSYSHGTLIGRVASSTSLSLAGHSFSARLQSIGEDTLVFKDVVGELKTARKLR